MTQPYSNHWIDDTSFYRIFEENTDDKELVWHRDDEDRRINVVRSDGWYIQFDNELPKELKDGDTIDIDRMRYHRIIKGKNRLIVRIEEL